MSAFISNMQAMFSLASYSITWYEWFSVCVKSIVDIVYGLSDGICVLYRCIFDHCMHLQSNLVNVICVTFSRVDIKSCMSGIDIDGEMQYCDIEEYDLNRGNIRQAWLYLFQVLLCGS